MPNTSIVDRIEYEYHDGDKPYMGLKSGRSGVIERVEISNGGYNITYGVDGKKQKFHLPMPIDFYVRRNLGLGNGFDVQSLGKCPQEKLEGIAKILLLHLNLSESGQTSSILGQISDELEQLRLLEIIKSKN